MKTALSNAQLVRTRVKVKRPVSTAFDTALKLYSEFNSNKITSTNTKTQNTTKACKKFRKVLVEANKATITNGAQSLTTRSPVKRNASTLVRPSVRATRPNSKGNIINRQLPGRQPAQLQLPMKVELDSINIPGTDIVISL